VLRSSWLAAVGLTCLAGCTPDVPVSATAANGSPASSVTAAAASTSAPGRSARNAGAFVVPKPEDEHRRVFGLIPCGKAWCAGFESASAKSGRSRQSPTVGIGRITERGLTKQADGPDERRLLGVAASAKSESPWWFYGKLADGRHEVFGVQRGGSARALFTAAGDDAIRFSFTGHAEVAWTAADPPHGIVYWRTVLADKQRRVRVSSGAAGDHFRPKITGYEHYVFTVAGGKSHTRKFGRPKGHDWRPIPQATLVAATDRAFLLVMSDHEKGVEAHWLAEDGTTTRKGTQSYDERWKLEAAALMASGEVVFAGKMGSPLADEQPLAVGGFDATGAAVNLRRLEPAGSRKTDVLAAFECGSSAWLIRRTSHGDGVESLDAYRLADAKPAAIRLWEGKVPKGHKIDHVFTGCAGDEAAVLASDRARFGRVSILVFVRFEA